MTVKTEISVPEELFQEALSLAEKLNISSSQLFIRALDAFVQKHRRENAPQGAGGPNDLELEEQIWTEAKSLKLDERFLEDDETR